MAGFTEYIFILSVTFIHQKAIVTAGELRMSNLVLEYFVNGSWWTVCGSTFTSQAADVACFKMGFRESYRIHSSPLRNPEPLLDVGVCPNSPFSLCVENGIIDCTSTILLECSFQGQQQTTNPTTPTSTERALRTCPFVCNPLPCRKVCPDSRTLPAGAVIGIVFGVIVFTLTLFVCILFGARSISINDQQRRVARERAAESSYDQELEVAAFDRQSQLNSVQNHGHHGPAAFLEQHNRSYSFRLEPVTDCSSFGKSINKNKEQPSGSLQQDAPPEYDVASQYVTVTTANSNSKLSEETLPSYDATIQQKMENTEP